MYNRLVAGVDCSTQSTKVIVVDVDNGEIKASGQVEHDVFRSGPASETDPENWWSALSTTYFAGLSTLKLDFAPFAASHSTHGAFRPGTLKWPYLRCCSSFVSKTLETPFSGDWIISASQ